MFSILANPPVPQGGQKGVHYPAFLRFDPNYMIGSKWADGTTDADIMLSPSSVIYGGASQNANLTINTLMSSWRSWLNEFATPSLRSVADDGFLRMVGDPWINKYKSLRTVRYSALKAITTANVDGTSAGVLKIISIIELDANRFVALWRLSSGSSLRATAGTIASDGTVTLGTEAVITSTSLNPNATNDHGVLVDTDKIAITSLHTSNYVNLTVITVSGNTITVGTPVALNATSSDNLSIAKLDTNKVIVGYNYSSSYKAIACTISGTVPTAGSEITVKAGATARTFLRQIDTNKAVMSLGATTVAGLFVISASGTVLTAGAEKDLPTDNAVVQLASHATGKFVALFGGNFSNKTPTVGLYTVSGTTITLADSAFMTNQGTNFTLGSDEYAVPYVFDTTKVAFFWTAELTTSNTVLPYTLVIDTVGDVLRKIGNPPLAGTAEIDQANNSFFVSDKLYSVLNGTSGAYMGSRFGMVGAWGIHIGTLLLTTGGSGFIATWKNAVTEFYAGASTGDTLIGTHTPTDPPIFVKTYVCDKALNTDKAYIKLKNVTGETISYDIYDVGFMVD